MSIENENLHIVRVFNELTFEADYEPCIYATRKLAIERADIVNGQEFMKATIINWEYKS